MVEGEVLEFVVTASDPDGDALTLSAALDTGEPVDTMGAVFTQLNNTQAQFFWTPMKNQGKADYKVVFTVDDGINSAVNKTAIITVLIPGDFNNDGDVDRSDLAVFAAVFGALTGSANYNSADDFDNDGDVDGSDLTVFASNFGRVSNN